MPMRRDEIAKLILQHILIHPEKKDTFEGILRWWIGEQVMDLRIAEVKAALDWLLVSDIIIEKKLSDSKTMYFPNKDKLPTLTELFNPSR